MKNGFQIASKFLPIYLALLLLAACKTPQVDEQQPVADAAVSADAETPRRATSTLLHSIPLGRLRAVFHFR